MPAILPDYITILLAVHMKTERLDPEVGPTNIRKLI
jgi:hypothetical protein